MISIRPVLLAGGSGMRLWPLSRKTYPKQFSELLGKNTLFQECALRLCSSKTVKFSSHITLTSSDFRFIVKEQLEGIGVNPGMIFVEPEVRNTAPSVLAASIYANKIDHNSILLIAPSDHVIKDVDAFRHSVAMGVGEILKGKIVTFGIKPTRAETGYGYLQCKEYSKDYPSDLIRFVEKPSAKLAQEMIKESTFLWNSGIFMFRARDMIDAFRTFCAELLSPVETALEHGKDDLGFFRFQAEAWSRCKNISIDYAIMEKANNLVAVPFSGTWSDLGDWAAVWKQMEPDDKGVSTSLNANAIDCSNTLLRSESKNQELIGLGLNNILAIAMPDAVLVADKDKAQNVREIVPFLKEKNIKQAELSPKYHRPWGWFEQLAIGSRFQVKRIVVNPGGALSLQSHKYRSEHWVVVQGNAKVTVNEEIKFLSEGQSVFIPQTAIHRMENLEKKPMIIVEVQTGSYLGEDDIIRYEDNYSRD